MRKLVQGWLSFRPPSRMSRPTIERTYKTVKGFFLHDDPRSPPTEAVPPRFGLVNRGPDRWDKFFQEVDKLNKFAPPGTSYKVIILSRHGQGFHNVGEAKYGTKAWDEHWSKLNGDGQLVWGPDPELTELGLDQARNIQARWKEEVAARIPLPSKRYTSPLTRAMDTCRIQFEDIGSFPNPVVVFENCREENGVHTCDKRRSRTFISTRFPKFQVDEGMTEEDELWKTDVRETHEQVAQRAKLVLDHIFEHDTLSNFVSITAHGGVINGFFNSVGLPPYGLPTGGIVPLVVSGHVEHLHPGTLSSRY